VLDPELQLGDEFSDFERAGHSNTRILGLQFCQAWGGPFTMHIKFGVDYLVRYSSDFRKSLYLR